MDLCSKCKKRPAVVFITTMHGTERKNEGFCIKCAMELNIPQVREYMDHMGISPEDFEQMSEQMMDLMGGDERFEPGGASTMPEFMRQMFIQPDSDPDAPSGKSSDKSSPKSSGASQSSRGSEKGKSDAGSGKHGKQKQIGRAHV